MSEAVTPEPPLAHFLVRAVQAAHFEQVRDFGPIEDACPGGAFCPPEAPPIQHLPNVDLAVIVFDRQGRVKEAANVLLSRNYPAGLIVPLNPDLGTDAVRFRRWDIERWNGGVFSAETGRMLSSKGWQSDPPLTEADDIVPGREDAAYQFMSPYPASGFKLLLAYYIMWLVDQAVLSLDQPYRYQVGEEKEGESRLLCDWLDPMITASDNYATKALLKQLWDIGQLEGLNAEFRDLGLGTLQINRTDPATGYGWQPGEIHMTALDTARLLWLIDGGPGLLWRRPDGNPITASELSAEARSYLKSLLAEQGLHEALSTTNLGGAAQAQLGIPARLAARWIDPADGTVTVGGQHFGYDVRLCNEQAEVDFMHKTGLTYNYCSDAGIVRSLLGQPYRHYIIAFFANLGYRYTDPVFAAHPCLPCYDPRLMICYTQRIATLGRQIDDWLKSWAG